MKKFPLKKPVIIYIYGIPGSGKSFVAKRLAEFLPVAHVSTDRIRSKLFNHSVNPTKEFAVASRLAEYIAGEFLRAGVGVVFDGNTGTVKGRSQLRELASKHKVPHMLIWLQIDADSAYARAAGRDKRTVEGKYSPGYSRADFDSYIGTMEIPKNEEFLVISGKHTFASQKSAIISRLYQLGLIDSSVVSQNVVKPELINLIPNLTIPRPDFGRQDYPSNGL